MPVRRTAPFATATLATAVLAMLLTSCSTTAAPATPTTSSSSSARDDSEQNHLIDISTAVAGLPDDVTVLGDGAGLTIMRADLDKL